MFTWVNSQWKFFWGGYRVTSQRKSTVADTAELALLNATAKIKTAGLLATLSLPSHHRFFSSKETGYLVAKQFREAFHQP